MTLDLPPGGTRSEEMLQNAQQHYADISKALKEAEQRLRNSDDEEAKKIPELIRMHWKSFQTAFDLEINLEKRDRERAGIVHEYALDLDAARAEVGRRLACLKAAAGD